MRISSARVKGFGPFGDVAIDFDALPESAKLIALCGENGVGKSTLVDLLVDGAAWREWPRRGGMKIDHVANDRDSMLEVTHEIGGKSYLIRHLVDGVSGKGESAVYLDGEALTKSGKLTEFYSFAKENFPAKSVVHSSIVSHPAYGSFVTMKATERKDVILLALGVDGIEKLAAAARKETERALVATDSIRETLAKEVAAADVEKAAHERQAVEFTFLRSKIDAKNATEALEVARQLAGDSALARQRYDELVAARGELAGRIDVLSHDLDVHRIALKQADCERSEALLTVANTERDTTSKALTTAETLAQSLRVKREAAQRQTEDRHRVQIELERVKASKADVEKRLANIREIIAKGDEIRAAVDKSKELASVVARLELESNTVIAELKRLGAEVSAHDADRVRHNEAAAETERRIKRASKQLENSEQVRNAEARLETEREAVAECKSNVETSERELETLRSRRIDGADDRIEALRGGLGKIDGCNDIGFAHSVARESIDADDKTVMDSEELPELISSAEQTVANYRNRLRLAEGRLRECESLAAQLPVIEAAELELASAREALNTALFAADESERKATEVETERAKLAAAGRGTEKLIRDTQTQIATLAELVGLADKLTAATGLRDERIAQLATATADLDRLTEELDALPEPEPVPADPDLGTLRMASERAAKAATEAAATLAADKATREHLDPLVARLSDDVAALRAKLTATAEPVQPETAPDLEALEAALVAAQNNHTAAAMALGVADAALEAAKSASVKVTALRADLVAAEMGLADWTRLAADLGRKGLQAALVDSAGPELTRATNDLLHSCFGPRWTVTYETQRVNGNGGTSEGYDIRIVDTERGRDGVVEDLSDGERTIISEAASLALSELACKRAGFTNPTLIRDESGAALSAERRPMWVAMLRRAAQHVNADRVIVISHSEDVQELCDVRMRVADGNVTVES